MKEKETKNIDNLTMITKSGTSPIVIKIEAPKETMKKKIQQQIKADEKKATSEEIQKPISDTRSRCCRFLPVLLFLVTFATVLTALIFYMDPSSEFFFPLLINSH